MKELSLNILDIAQNSITAGASRITVEIAEDFKVDRLTILVKDNGCGMDREFLKKVTDPFTTTRTTRKVGLGIPLFKLAAEMAGGSFKIESEINKGTAVTATFMISHIDRPPLGDMAETVAALISAKPDIDYLYIRSADGKSFELDTLDIRKMLPEIPLDDNEVITFVKDYITENEKEIHGGV